MPFVKNLGKYALGQIANNLPTVLTAGGVLIGSTIDRTRLPSPIKTLLKGTIAASLTVIAHNGSSPANQSESIVQNALRPSIAKKA